MYRRRLVVRDRSARPMTELTIGDANGRLCYFVAGTRHGAIAVSLQADQVDDVIEALSAWRDDRRADQEPYGRLSVSAQSTAGLLGRSPV